MLQLDLYLCKQWSVVGCVSDVHDEVCLLLGGVERLVLLVLDALK